MENIYRYPLDLSAMANTNIEVNILEVPQTRNRAFALNGGSFYSRNLSVVNTRTGKPLLAGKDFRLESPVEELYVRTQEPAFSFIHFTHEDAYGSIKVTAQMVGDKYENLNPLIVEKLRELQLDNRTVEFENLVGKPVTLPPTQHLHHVSELFGFKDFIDVIEKYIERVSSRDGSLLDQFTERFNGVNTKYLELIELINQLGSGSGELDSKIEALKIQLDNELRAIRESIRVDAENLSKQIENFNELKLKIEQDQKTQDTKIQTNTDNISKLDRDLNDHKTQMSNALDAIDEVLSSHTLSLESISGKLQSLTQAFNSPVVHVNKTMTVAKPANQDHMTIFVTTNSQFRLPDITQFKNFCTITVLVRSGIVPWMVGYDSSNVFYNGMAESNNYDPELKWNMNMSFKLVKVGTKTWEVIL